MKRIDRRSFLAGGVVAGMVSGIELYPAALGAEVSNFAQHATSKEANGEAQAKKRLPGLREVDFRYSPTTFQSTFCFPDDSEKSLVGEHGDLRYDFVKDAGGSIHDFGTVVDFGLAGMPREVTYRQWLEAPGVPIIHTRQTHARAGAAQVQVELVTFASRRKGESRVDNVLMEIRPQDGDVIAAARVHIRSSQGYKLAQAEAGIATIVREGSTAPWMYSIALDNHQNDLLWRLDDSGFIFHAQHGTARAPQPLRYFFRIPQGGEKSGEAAAMDVHLSPDKLLGEVRAWWKNWRPFEGRVAWSLPGKSGDFLVACARNIQQAREERAGRLVFEVGPTVYRGLWIVDGNFLLEAARYLGYDKDADQGLLSEWEKQLPSGQIAASAGLEHSKDTAIAIFTLVRACELKQDWSLLRDLTPQVHHAVEFLIGLRNEARKGDSKNGRYGLLAPGFPDGGIGGVHSEFTNTLWTLAGLRALAGANDRLGLEELSEAGPFYRELRTAFDLAAEREMVRDPRGFRYLPMLMSGDPLLNAPNPWDRPRPQTAQWALSQAIYPGELFEKDSPIVQGHIRLMQACTQEDIPAETGWLWHEAVWTYNAPFVAEVYLWAGMQDWAHRTFTGFLNHASPLFAWREEQPLQNALLGELWGDMPHNWASAECVRYLRHRLVLEDRKRLRLLAGMTAADWGTRRPFSIEHSPTRFGWISLIAEPFGRSGWRIGFEREGEREPKTIEAPRLLAAGANFKRMEGASARISNGGMLEIDPSARKWTAVWD